MSSRDWVYEKFCSYYKNPSFRFPSPTQFGQREYAFLLFKERTMLRHRSFATPTALTAFLRRKVASDVYHSCAYYENPEAEMDKKGWSGADLVFDIDADHIPTSCNKIHDEWKCSNSACRVSGGMIGKGLTPEECPACGGMKFDVKTWACDLCIETTKVETRKLLDMLMNDFGFDEHEIHTYFSGHRGYHIHVENEAIRSLDTMARKEIVDYVAGTGLDIFNQKKQQQSRTKRKASPVFSLSEFGWKRRLKNAMYRYLTDAKIEDLTQVGVSKKAATILTKNRDTVLKRCIEDNRWDSIRGVGYETWRNIAEHVKNCEAAQIDTVVTTDVHRLIRANGTLHGKTGLLKIEFPIRDLETFDPFLEAVAFKEGTAKVQVSEAPEFRLSGEKFGPFKDKTAELPTAAAVLLILKGRAEVMK